MIYRFKVNGREVLPNYKQDMALEYTKEQGEQFYRSRLSGSLKFMGKDFEHLAAQSFEQEMGLLVESSSDRGESWTTYWTGVFYKTDGKWDFDNKIVEVNVEPKDIYTELLKGMEREYNLIELAPPIYPVLVDKRPLIQIYQAGSSTVGCFLGGNAWEQDVASPVWNVDAEHEESLQKKYHFTQTGTFYEVKVTEFFDFGWPSNPRHPDPQHPSNAVGVYSGTDITRLIGPEGFYLSIGAFSEGTFIMHINIEGTGQTLLTNIMARWNTSGAFSTLDGSYLLSATPVKRFVYSRYLTALPEMDGQIIHRLPSDDITPNNRNYQYAMEYASGGVVFSSRVTSEPTKFGRREFEWLNPAEPEYYLPPTDGDFLYYPVSRLNWGYHSIWFRFREADAVLEKSLRSTYTLPDAFKLVDAIKVLAEKIIGSSIEVRATELEMDVEHMITPKSNITAGSYSLAAQRAPVKLKELLAMLKDIFQSYWYLKMEDGKLILDIRPISWFNERPTSVDTTEITNKRNGLPWSFATDKVEYNKLDMPSRYEFGWAEPTSILFDGEPIEIRSKFVERDKVESISITKFNTDIDFMLLAPEKVNPDGFALLKTVTTPENNHKIEYLIETGAAYKELQNGYLSWYQLHEDTWCVDMPAERALVNGHLRLFYDNEIVKNKKQTISFPVGADPAPELLIKTSVGLGKIEKLSVYLHSRMAKAELRQNTYD